MNNISNADFDASASLIGYLYQVRMALVLFLQRFRADPGIALSIEIFDDIAFHSNVAVLTQLQTKHVSTKNLTDASVDLWKTLRIWSHQYRTGLLDPAGTTLVLLTTATAQDGTAASYLRNENRNSSKAVAMLEAVARNSRSVANKAAYEEFLLLPQNRRAILIRSINVHDASPGMLKVPELLAQELRLVVAPSHLSAMATRLEGWWLQVVVDHLAKQQARISAGELDAELEDLRQQFKMDNLPIDFADVEPPSIESFDHRRFVQQLNLIKLHSKRIARAILDYYRALQQRNRWISDHLVGDHELRGYERRLREDWAEMFEGQIQTGAALSREEVGRNIYDSVVINHAVHLRPSCTEPFVMRGTYHLLANDKRVGWHPDYETLIGDADAE